MVYRKLTLIIVHGTSFQDIKILFGDYFVTKIPAGLYKFFINKYALLKNALIKEAQLLLLTRAQNLF